MGKYSEVFDEADKLSEEEFAGKLKELNYDEKKLLELAPEGPDRDAILKLGEEIKIAENAQAAKEAWTNFGKIASDRFIEVVRKVVIG